MSEPDWALPMNRRELIERIGQLETALLDLYSGTAEYVYLNHLGDPHNTTPMRNAAKVLGAPALEAYDRLARLTLETNCKPCSDARSQGQEDTVERTHPKATDQVGTVSVSGADKQPISPTFQAKTEGQPK